MAEPNPAFPAPPNDLPEDPPPPPPPAPLDDRDHEQPDHVMLHYMGRWLLRILLLLDLCSLYGHIRELLDFVQANDIWVSARKSAGKEYFILFLGLIKLVRIVWRIACFFLRRVQMDD